MHRISAQQTLELLHLVLTYNHRYYMLTAGMSPMSMYPDEILQEFRLAFEDYSDYRVSILKEGIATLEKELGRKQAEKPPCDYL